MDKTPFKTRLGSACAFIFDYDGVFTDGIVVLLPGNVQARTANTRDGFAVQHAVKQGLQIGLISGGRDEEVAVRMRGLGLGAEDVVLNASEKLPALDAMLARWNLKRKDVCYMGDDLPDLPMLEAVGLACCPRDAAPEVRAACDYVSPMDGGKGCVRDVLEQAMRLRKVWNTPNSHSW